MTITADGVTPIFMPPGATIAHKIEGTHAREPSASRERSFIRSHSRQNSAGTAVHEGDWADKIVGNAARRCT